MPDIVNLARDSGADVTHFDMCMVGASSQRRTTLLYTSALSSWLEPLRRLDCNHRTHGKVIDSQKIKASAAYPPEFNLYLAKSFVSLHTAVERPLPPQSMVIPTPKPSDKPTTDPYTEIDVPVPLSPPKSSVPTASPHSVPKSSLPLLATIPPNGNLASLFESAAMSDNTVSEQDGADTKERQPRAHGESVRNKYARAGHDIRDGLRSRRALLALSGAIMTLSSWTGRANLVKPLAQDPRNRREALSQDEAGWTTSMDAEIKNQEDNNSWEWVPRREVPVNRHLVKLVWVYKVKRDGRLKSRLCVQGCAQTAGVDYDQTHSATLQSPSLRLLASLAAREGMGLHRYDFVSAYLQGVLEDGEVVFCYPPPGYERQDSNGEPMCCKVIKPIYGMAQAGRRWQRTLFPWLEEFGLTASEHDPCLFHMERSPADASGTPTHDRLVVGVYVDDLAIAYKLSGPGSLYDDFVTALNARWKVEDEGELSDLLGVDFEIDRGNVTLKQSRYIRRLVSTYLNDTPLGSRGNLPHGKDLPSHVADGLAQSNDAVDPLLRKKYQSIVGALLYCATNTRPDVAYAVGYLCRAMNKPTDTLYADAEQVLRYLQRTEDIGLRYAATKTPVHGFSDSDWAVQHSTSGWVFMLNHAAISWGSKKQKSVALSSCEAEIVAASDAAKEAVHLSALCNELGIDSGDRPVDLFVDNKSAIDVAYNPQHHGRMKHVDRRHFYIRELIEEHRIRVPFVSTVNNIADFFTKPLLSSSFFRLRDIIMNVPEHLREKDVCQTMGGRCET